MPDIVTLPRIRHYAELRYYAAMKAICPPRLSLCRRYVDAPATLILMRRLRLLLYAMLNREMRERAGCRYASCLRLPLCLRYFRRDLRHYAELTPFDARIQRGALR